MSEKEKALEEMKKLREEELSEDSIKRDVAVSSIERKQYEEMKKEFESFSPLKQAWYKMTKKAVKTDDGSGWRVNRRFDFVPGPEIIHEQKRFVDGKYMTMDDLEKAVEREKEIENTRNHLREFYRKKILNKRGRKVLTSEESLKVEAKVEDYLNRMYPDYEEKEHGRSIR